MPCSSPSSRGLGGEDDVLRKVAKNDADGCRDEPDALDLVALARVRSGDDGGVLVARAAAQEVGGERVNERPARTKDYYLDVVLSRGSGQMSAPIPS